MSKSINEEALQAAKAKVQLSAEKFGPMGRPADSACACKTWPCPCACHRPMGKRR